MKVRNALLLMIAVIIAFMAPTKVSAQASDSTKACYVPTTGNVYRIGVGSTPAACRPGHGFNLLGLTLPMYREINHAGTMLNLKNLNAAGFVARFEASGNGHAVRAQTNSTGPATIHAENTNTGTVLWARNTSTGQALYAEANNTFTTAHIENKGAGSALFSKSAGGSTIYAENTAANGNAMNAKATSDWSAINAEQLGAGIAVRAVSTGGYALMAESNRTVPGPAAHIENKGAGMGLFTRATAGNTIYAENTGTTEGNALNAKSASSWNTVDIMNTGTGAGLAVTSSGENATANFNNNGTGNSIYASSANQYSTVFFQNTGTVGGALNLKGLSANANVMNIESVNGGGAIYGSSNGGTFATANFNQLASGGLALQVSGRTNLSGNTTVHGNLHTNGNTSVSGSKSAAVLTSAGQRLMYTEEATEVWFTDYGFGKLQNGEVFVPIDALYAETANLNEPYHVFLQSYGPAELYVTNRTATGFTVKVSKGDTNSEFSYRIVAKRMNFENERLESAGH